MCVCVCFSLSNCYSSSRLTLAVFVNVMLVINLSDSFVNKFMTTISSQTRNVQILTEVLHNFKVVVQLTLNLIEK